MFDLYFSGNVNVNFEVNMKARGANRLGTAKYNWDYLDRWWGKNRGFGGKIFIDSGAFTAHTKGLEIDIDEYIYYLNFHDEDIELCAELDKIPGVYGVARTKQQVEEAAEISWENYLYMLERCKSPEKVMPLFHQGENFSWLENMLNHKVNGNYTPYIGIAPAKDLGLPDRIKFMEQCFDFIKKSNNPDVKTHAFGMTSLNLLEQFPFTSADSTSWVILAGVGGVMTPNGSVMVSEQSIHNKHHYRRFKKSVQKAFSDFCLELGYRVADLEVDYIQRILFNVDYLMRWARDYKYIPNNIKQLKLI